MIFMELTTIILAVDILYDGEIYVEEDILENLDINSKLGFLISRVIIPLDDFGVN